MPANLENSAVAAGLEQFSFHSNPAKQPSNYNITLFISQASKLMLKILQARSTANEPRDSILQIGFPKGRETRDQIANIHWIIEKQVIPEKHLVLLH